MKSKTYKHIAVESHVKDEFDKIKEDLKKINTSANETNTLEILLKKHYKIQLPMDEVYNLFSTSKNNEKKKF